MKKSVIALFTLAVLAVTLSCGESETSDSQIDAEQLEVEQTGEEHTDDQQATAEEDEDTVTVVIEEAPVAFLELCYATSVNMPQHQYGPENVFDNDPSTCWATMPGAAPDEGLFFSFEEPIIINAIRIESLSGSSSFEGISYYQLYINGSESNIIRATGEPIPINAWVRSIFIRIDATDSMEYERNGIRYAGSLPVGISDISLTVIGEAGTEVPLNVQPISKMSGFVQASSCLEPEEAYHTDFLFDSRAEFGWTDGNESSTGEGESLSFYFDQAQRIEKIKIWNGYHRSQTHFEQNERASLISFGNDSSGASEYRLANIMEPQVIALDTPLEGSSFTLKVLEIHEGATYKDLVISELQFYDGERWFVLDSGESLTRKHDVLQWANNTAAEAFIDKQIYYSRNTAWEEYTQTLVLRSNGSFVLWKHEETDGSSEIMYADGNWQIIDANTIEIFGRLHRIGHYSQASYDPYSGVRPGDEPDMDRITMFNDTLQFDSSRISSDWGLFEDFEF